MDIIIEFPDNDGFGLVHCPHCGETENLDWSIEENWDCPKCGKEFWITPARIISKGIPTFVTDGHERYTPIEVHINAVIPDSDKGAPIKPSPEADAWANETCRIRDREEHDHQSLRSNDE